MIFLAILAFVFGLGLIVLIHEFGHFIFAKRAGILCFEFSIGMGPAIYKKKKGETTYCIRAIPIGGYVSMAGEDVNNSMLNEEQEIGLVFDEKGFVTKIELFPDDSSFKGIVKKSDLYGEKGELYITLEKDNEEKTYGVYRDAFYVLQNGNLLQIAPYERCFESKKLLDRFLSVVAGPAMNFVLAIILYFVVALFSGAPNYNSSTLGSVSGAASDKLAVGDVVTKIDNYSIETWYDLSETLDLLIGEEEISFTVTRNGQTENITISPYIYIGNLGFYGKANDTNENGVIVNAYTVNAENAGLKNGDTVTKIDGYDVSSWKDLIEIAKKYSTGSTINVDVIHEDGSQEVLSIETLGDDILSGADVEKISMKVGISPENHFDLWWSLKQQFIEVGSDVSSIFKTLGLLFTSDQVGIKNLSGPVGIFKMIENSILGGFLVYLAFIAYLSVNIGLINLLPIPALDGGRIVFLGYELITRKKVNRKVENIIHTVMLILIMILFVYITFNDILRLI